MTNVTDRSSRRVGTVLLLVLPFFAIVLSAIVWITAVSRSGFWADDFLNVTYFNRSLGSLSNDHINTGKYIANFFWAIGTEAFGQGSVVPFLLFNSLVFATGLVIWLRVGTKTRWSAIDAWWIGGLFIATAAWLPTALWSSNIVHSGGFLALGLGLLAHERAMSAQSVRDTAGWSAASGAAWTFAVVSDLIYIGFLVIAIYCAWQQIAKLRRLGSNTRNALVIVASWSLLLPLLYFGAVAYPATTSSSAYAKNGLQFVHENLRYYRSLLAPSALLTTVYATLLVGGIAAALAALRRRELFPIAVLGAAGATALPALVQSQQRDIHYMAIPLLLFFSALAAGMGPVLYAASAWVKTAVLLAAALTILLVFRQGADFRAFFVSTPYGHDLATFRSQVAALTPEDGVICVNMDVDASHQALLIAQMSGENGFLVPPISASRAYLLTATEPCPAGSATRVVVTLNTRGDFVASA